MTRLVGFLAAAALAVGFGASAVPALAAEGAAVSAREWSFNGVFGTFDRAKAQRGYLVYKQVCSSCHAVKYLAFRNLVGLGFTEAEAKALAAEAQVTDGPNDEGEMFQRPGRLLDRLPHPYANDAAARAANGGALPPDLSLITKAREHGPDYVYAVLTGYGAAPGSMKMATGMNYNKVFSGNQIAMPQPLSDNQVDYADGTKATVAQMAEDVVTFLHWAAEPNLEERHRLGFQVILFLLGLTILFWFVKQRVWRDQH
ncbi:MAG: cytochrome c1 [Alphaproteobacteria bacterium]|nr:cytochrome c1 [Alphaproteobacteria bacterium]